MKMVKVENDKNYFVVWPSKNEIGKCWKQQNYFMVYQSKCQKLTINKYQFSFHDIFIRKWKL